MYLSGFRFYLWGLVGYVFFLLILVGLFWMPASSTLLIIVGVFGEGLTRLWEMYQEGKAAAEFPERWQKWNAMYSTASIWQRVRLFPHFKPVELD